VELKKETLDALFVGPVHLDEPALPRDVVGHFLHLAAELQEWIGVLS
jgi:hypothetical protein